VCRRIRPAAIYGGRVEIAFEIPVRVYYQDTDAGGVVFHATYLDFFERARMDWLRTRGFEPKELEHRFGLVFIVRELEIAYARPAVLDDLLRVSAVVAKIGRAQATFAQEVRRGEELLVRAAVNIACVATRGFRPMPIPDPVRAVFAEEVGAAAGTVRD
jgi:acyl-CoA thioester hydrolase